MIAINVSTNARAAIDNVALDQREVRRVIVRALNRTADGVRTDAFRKIRETYNVTNKALRGNDRRAGAIAIRRANDNHLIAVVTASGNPLPLSGFAPRETRKGVSISVRKGVRKVLAGSFIARMKSGHVGVFMRRAAKRLPIDEKYTVDFAHMFGAKDVQAAIEPLARGRFDAELDRQIGLIVNRKWQATFGKW